MKSWRIAAMVLIGLLSLIGIILIPPLLGFIAHSVVEGFMFGWGVIK